jgi:hypothetical protein
MLLGKKTLWVAIAAPRPLGRGWVGRVDARSGRLLGTVRLPVSPYQLAYGFGSLWVTGETDDERYRGVLRIDPRSGRVLAVIRSSRPQVGSKLAATSDAIWVNGADIFPKGHEEKAGVRYVYKIDPRRNAIVRRVRLASTTTIALLGEGTSLWATGWGAVVKLSTSGRVLFEQRFGGSGWSIARTRGAVWVAEPWFGGPLDRRQNRPSRRVLKIATSGPQRVTVIELPGQPGGVSAAVDVVWLSAVGLPLARLDARATPPIVTEVTVNLKPSWIEAFPGGVWVAELGRNRVSKIC